MNQLQTIITRIFRLEKPIDKRILWASLAAISLIAFIVFSSLNDASSSTSVSTSKRSNAHGFDLASTTTSQAGSTLPSNKAGFKSPKIFVHVVGQVKRAGLYVLDSGARVADAILAADGFTRFADQASVNLARLLSDGEQIAVARQSSDGSASQTMTNESTPLINLNRATEQQIEGLPGVGPTLAGRIVDWRIANGGFKTKADLQKVSGIGEKLFAQLKDLVSL